MTAHRAPSTRPRSSLAAILVVGLAVLVGAAPAAADSTAPTVNFGQWTESSPYAHHDATADADRVWFNPLFSGSATARVVATDGETGVAHLTWPDPPTGWSPAGSNDTAASDLPGLVGTYWNNSTPNQYPGTANFTGTSVTRIDPAIDFAWGSGSPSAAIANDTFSARWTGTITAPETGTYYFQATSNDGMKVAVDGVEVVSFWTDSSGAQDRAQCAGGIALVAGSTYDFKAEFYENATNTSTMQLRWRLPSQSGAYQTPTGCDTLPADREKFTQTYDGGPGGTQYPVIPSSAFKVGGGAYTRTFSWNAAAAGGVVGVTATNNDVPQDTSASVPIEFVADETDPVAGGSGTLDIQSTGWGADGNNTLVFPRADTELSDAGASASNAASMTRMLQRRDGVANGTGGCDTGAGTWTDIGTPALTATTVANGFAMIPAAGVCSEFRYLVTDAVGNTLELYASGFRGWDAVAPSATVTAITEGTNPQYQHVAGPDAIFYNGNQTGSFTVTATPTDSHSGPYHVRFNAPGNNWILPTAAVDAYDPDPYEATYEWGATSANLGTEVIRVWDYAGQWADVTSHSITRDVTGPSGGAFNPPDGTTWHNTPSATFDMTTARADGTGSGVASYQLQREEVAWTSGACPAFTGTYTNIGAPVFGNPPPPITAVTDTTVVDGRCYRYRVESADNVSNISYLVNTNSVRVDDTNPAVTLNALPANGSGTITVGGSATDSMSGIANVTVRLEDLATPGPTVTLYTDTTVAPAWGDYSWNTSALNGSFRLHVDVTDVAGNVVTSARTHDIVLDNTIPTIVHTGFAEGTNPEYQHIDPVAANHRAWVKTAGIGAATPSISANFFPEDPESGIDFVTAPAAPGGTIPWSPTTTTQVQDPGPYTQQYRWAAGVAAFTTRSATATSNAAKVSLGASFTITTDNNAPGLGGGGAVTGSISPQPTSASWHTSLSLPLSITNYVDATAGSGVAVQRVERDEVPRNATGQCTTATWPGTWSTVVGTPAATLPATITDTTLVHGMCYRYRLVATDNVGNVASTSATPTPVVADVLAPTATLDATPTSPYRGTETLTGTSTDGATDGSNSGIANVTLRWRNLGDLTSGTIGTDTGANATPAYSLGWNTALGATPDGAYRIFVDVTDVATNTVTAVATRDVVIDNSPPVVTLDSFVEGSLPDCQHWSGAPSSTFWFSGSAPGCGASDFTIRVGATDAPGGMAFVRFPDTATTGNVVPDAGSPADDPTGTPFEMRYTYPASPSNPGTETIRAEGSSGASTNLTVTLGADVTGPTGHTISGPGASATPGWWSRSLAPAVTFDVSTATDAEAGVRPGAHVLERRDAAGPGCGTWSAYAAVGAPGLSSPHADSTTTEDTCYQYRLAAIDNVNNRTYVTSADEVRVDRTLPGGTIDPVPAYVRGSSVALSGTSSDNWAGVASVVVRLGAGPTTACTPAVAASWSCTWDTTGAPDGPTTLVLVVTDHAGNVLDTQTQPTYVENEAPATTVTLAEGATPGAQHVVAGPTPRIYVNTATGSSGDFTATATPSDAFSGVASVTFPDLGTNWTPAGGVVATPGPYEFTYAWTGDAATGDPGATTIQVADAAANASTATFEVVADVSAPSSVTVDYEDGPTPTPSVTFDEGADPGSGVASWRIERRETTVNGPNTCDTTNWSAWTTAAADPAVSPWTDGSVVLNRCYQYRIVTVDNVGNVTTAGDATDDTVTIEPAGIVIVESASTTDVTEGGATDTYTVRLRTRPSASVDVALATGDGQVATDVPALTFTTANWNVAQVVTVTAVDDDADEVPDPHAGTITHVADSSDVGYDALTGADVVAAVTDDDESGFVVSPAQSSVAVLEAGATSGTYAIRLQSKPAADVVVTLGNADGEVSVAPATLTFTDATWNADQVVTVTAVDDDYDEVPDAHDGVVTHAVTSGDALYAPLTIADTTATVTDDDAAGVTVAPTSGLSVEEGDPATDQYLVELDSEPVGTVTINVVDDADVDVSTTTLSFDATNWDTPQPVDVSAFQDAIAEGPHTGTVSHTATALDPDDAAYGTVAIDPVAVGVLDDDVPGIEVTPTSGLTATEGGAGSSYQVRLESEPTDPVTISFATGTQVEPIADLAFTAANWNTYQTVTVAAEQDDVDEVTDPHAGTIAHTVDSLDPTYDGWSLADQPVAITDDDEAGITVAELGGVDVDEANVVATDTFTVVLDSEPVGTVTITPTADAQVATSAAVTFDDTDWSTPKAITVTAVDDDVDETDPHPGAVALDATGDPRYDALTAGPVTADVADDDTAAFVVSTGTLALDEDLPADDALTVRLASEPTAPVTVDVTTDAQSTATPATLTFTSATWNVDQAVTVTAVDDPTVEDDPHATGIGIAATAGDPAYVALPAEAAVGSIADNDVAGVTVDEADGVDVAEGTGTDQYTVVLDRQPLGDVTVTVAPDGQVVGMPTTLTFTNANWNVAQTVTVSAVDDDVDEGAGTHPGGLTHTVSSTDPRWAGVTSAAPVAVDVTDDDVAGVSVTASSPYALSEDTPSPATTVSYDVVLDSEPTGPVDIDLTIPGDLAATPATLSFDPSNWDGPQAVTVGAIDDLVTEAPVHARTITHAVTTGDPTYGPITVASVAFDVTDNDVPGIVVTETALAATEGGAVDTFAVELETQPTAPVTIDLTGTQVGVDADPIVFTASDWNVAQTVTVTAVDDLVDEHPDTHAGLVELAVTSPDAVYDDWPLTDIAVAITDDDDAGVTIAPGSTAIAVAEAGTTSATYTVVLDTEPTAPVTVTPAVGDGQATVAPASLTFTQANWNVAQSITVTAVDDPDDEPTTHAGAVTHVASSADVHYDATLAIDPQAIDVTDDDTTGVVVAPTSGIALDEAALATTGTFTVVLGSRPAGNVDVSFDTTDGQATAAPGPITFTPTNWNVAQTVTITVVDDEIDEAATHAGLVAVDADSATDALYDAFDPADVAVTIADDDTAGVIVTESGGSTDVDEALVSDTYLVRLATQPTANVTIDITGGPDASTTPVQLTFTAATWNTDQAVTVNGTPDFVIEGAHDQAITHAITAGDADYVPALAIASVTAHVTDDDAAGATITPTNVLVTEGAPGVTATYDVVLDAQPASNVTIALTPDGEVLVSTPSLVFTTANWNVPQTVTVTADDDLVAEPSPHVGLVQHAMSSGDADFNVAVADVTVDVTDDDDPGVGVTPTSLTVAEGGPGATFSVVLESLPSSSVDVTFTASSQLAPLATVTFTPGNWNVAQTVAVGAFDDLVAEGAHTATITMDTASTDPYYAPGSFPIDPVDVAIGDNDTAGVLVAPSAGLSGTEGGAAVTYAVSLTSQPIAPVTITVDGDADGVATPATLTFDAATWATPQDVDVAIVQDAIAEGAHTTTIGHDVSAAGDPTYDTAVTVADQVVAVGDDDTAGVVFTPALPGPLAIGEDGPDASYTVRLTSEPTGDVTIDVASLAGQATATPATLTFGAANWMTPQPVDVVAVDDDDAEADPHTDSLTHTAGGADPTYAAFSLADMDLTITDDDVPAVLIDATLPDSSVDEGGLGDTVRVRLGTRPTANVDVTLSSTQLVLGATTLTFTPATWSTPQDVAVDAVQDDVFEGPHSGTIDALTGSAGDANYAGVAATQHAVAIDDDDTAGVVVTQAAPNTLDEAAPLAGADYAVRLQSEPTQPVDVTLAPDPQVATATTTLTFAPANWDTDQLVTVRPVDDALAEPTPHPGAVAHDTVSVDPAYAAGVLAIDDAAFDVADDDTPGILITPTAPHAVTEGGATSTYDLVLESQPTTSVTVAPVSSQLEWTVANVVFTPTNWNVVQTVTLRAIDDTFDEPSTATGTIVHSITTGDPGYQSLLPADVTADVTDDDTSELLLTPTTGLSVDEAGSVPATYTLTLTSTPTANVTVTLGTPAPAQLAFTPATVTLTAANWNTGVTVDVAAVDDDVDEASPLAATVTHAMASGDANFGGEAGPDLSVDVADDDAAGVTIAPSGPDTTVHEDGSIVDGYDVVLASEPVADVEITITPDSQVVADPTVLTFTADDWDDPQTVDVEAFGDFVIEGPHTGTLAHAASSDDPDYDAAAMPIADVVANVLDDDAAGVVVTPAGGTFEIAEGTTSDQLVITLTSSPVAPVTIDLTTADGESTVTPTSVVLDGSNWNTGVTVDVAAVDDASIEGTHAATVSLAVDPGSDPAYVGHVIADQVAQVSDDDVAAVLVDELDGLALDEAATATTDTFEVRLQAAPVSGDTVTVAVAHAGGQLGVAPSTLTFDDGDWNVAQPVTLTAVDDQLDEADPHAAAITFTTTSGDADFQGLTVADVDAAIADDDTAGVVLDATTVAVGELGATSDVVNVRLSSEPIGDVEVAVAADGQVAAAPAGPLVFDSGTWNVDQPVTITAVDDLDDEDDPHPGVVTLDATSVGAADPNYDAVANAAVTADVADDDTSEVRISGASGTEVVEADPSATVSWDIQLETRPSAPVDVTFVPDGQLEVVGSEVLTFTTTNWNVPQVVEVRALDDDLDELDPHTGMLAVTVDGADARYAALTPGALTIDVRDEDTAGVTIVQTPAVQPLAEDGSRPAATYDVVLDSAPTDPVTVSLAPDTEVATGGITELTFAPGTWNVAQPVTVTAVDDILTEPTPHDGFVEHDTASLDSNYMPGALTIDDAAFGIDDDDVPGFHFDPATPTADVDEDGATSTTYDLYINTVPSSPVTVEFAAANGEVDVEPASHTFTATNATVPVEITVTAIDDARVEATPHADLVTHAVAAGSDPTYLALPAPAIPDVAVGVADDDVAELLVDAGPGGLVLDEADPAATGSVTLALAAQPASDVEVALAITDGQMTVDLQTVTFLPGTWNVPQTVTATVVDDALDELDPHASTISFTTESLDGDFDAMDVPDLAASIADDDVPAFAIDVPLDLTMDEADVSGSARTVHVELETEPATPVTVEVVADATQLTRSSPVLPTIVLDATNWEDGVDVVLEPVDDDIAEGTPHVGELAFTVDPGSDPSYAALAIAPVAFQVTDDDVAGVAFTPPLPGPLAIAEGGATASYDVALTSEPVGAVTVDVAAVGGEATVDAPTLTFTAADWGDAQTVTVTAVDDGFDEASPHADELTHVVGGDATYSALALDPMDLAIDDDDTVGVTITQPAAAQPLAEDGGVPAATYTVQLDSAPSDDVTMTLAPDQVAVGGAASLTFTSADWDDPQTVSVTALDDLVAEAPASPLAGHEGAVEHVLESDDPAYDALTPVARAVFDIADDDVAGFAFEPTPPAPVVDEGDLGTVATYELSIGSEPAAPVTVDLDVANDQVDVTPDTHTFTAANAATPVEVAVVAVDDDDVEAPSHPDTITHAVTTTDSDYGSIAIPDVLVAVADDDIASVAVDVANGVAVAEAAAPTSDAFSVSLDARPSQPVTVAFGIDTTQATVAPASLTFDATTWNDPQVVTVTAAQDQLVEANPHAVAVSITTESDEPAFDGLAVPDVPVAINDDDIPAFVVSDPGDLTLDEAGAGTPAQDRTIRLALATAPTAPVTVTANGGGQVWMRSLNTLTFDEDNWQTGIELVVGPAGDDIAESNPHTGNVTFSVTSADPVYRALTIDPLTFTIVDDDLANAGIACRGAWTTNADGRVEMSEDEASEHHDVTCTVQLGTPASAPVTVDIAVAPTMQVEVSDASVTVPAGEFGPVEVTFTAIDDAIAEGAHSAAIGFDVSSIDPVYDALTIPAVDVDIADNDAVGTVLTPIDALTAAEGGTGSTFTVALTSQPTSPVVIDLAGDSQVGASPASLTFLPTTWNVPQSVGVNAIDDPVDEADTHPGSVGFTIVTSDISGYGVHAISNVAVSVTDNDTPGVVVTASEGGNAVGEAGTTDTASVRLGTVPTADVTVTLDAGPQLVATPATLTFTSATWDDAQAVTIAAAQDPVVEGEHTGTITFAIASDDPAYAAGSSSTPAGQAVTITDDDLAGVTVVETETKTAVAEAGGTDTYTIALSGQPTADVTIAANGTQVAAAPASLTFTPANWSTPQTVTVTAVQDSIDEADPHAGAVAHVATTSASGWAGANITGVVASVADDDLANVVVVQSDGGTKVVEGNSRGDTITFALSSQPSSDVSIVAKGDAQLTVSDKPIVLSPAKWKEPVSLKVAAVDDDEVEGEHEGTITFALTSDDPSYKKAASPAVTVVIGDNDVDKALPQVGDEDEEDAGTRGPRANVPPATIRRPGGDSGADTGDERRTSEGSTRTDAGRTRTPEGVLGTPTPSRTNPDGVTTPRRLGGEVVAAEEQEDTRPARKTPMARVASWLKENWLLAALVVGGGTMVAGTGAWLMRGDPIKTAQRATRVKGAAEAARRGADSSTRPRVRRVGKKRRKDDEDDEDDGPSPGARRRR